MLQAALLLLAMVVAGVPAAAAATPKPRPRKIVKKPTPKRAIPPTVLRPMPVMQVTPPAPQLPAKGRTEAGKEFYKCMLGLAPGQPTQIPDGLPCKTLPLSQQVVVSIIPDANGNIAGWVEPGLPSALKIVKGGSFSCVPLYGGGASNTFTPNGALPAVGVPFVEDANGAQGGISGYVLNFRNMIKARFVGGCLTLTPTGPPLTRQGMIAIADVEVNREAVMPAQIQIPSSPAGPTAVSGNQPVCYANVAGFQTSLPDLLSYSALSSMPGASTCEYGEVKCTALLKPGSLYGVMKPVREQWVDVSATPDVTGDFIPDVGVIALAGAGTGTSPTGGSIYSSANVDYDIANNATGSGATPSRPILANYWTERGATFKCFAATGLAATQPLMIVVDQCVEVCVSQVSAYRNFTRSVPKADTTAIKAAVTTIAALPPSVPSPPSKPWYSTLAEVVASVGSTVATLGIPWLSPIAGAVGSVASGISGLKL